LRELGVEVWQSAAGHRDARLAALLDELGRRQMTNILVEGGAEVLGALFDLDAIDEIHAFIAPRIVGGDGVSPIAGRGLAVMADARRLSCARLEQVGDDAYIHGRIVR
jgi:diaminohydroxyphosphoribosylaminopyrimidine deaminase / 5-amino-6-(5-phosphoribosylamino)uracil reductase